MPRSGSYFYPSLNGNMGTKQSYNQIKVGDGTRAAQIDHESLIAIRTNHHRIHEGLMFNVSEFDVDVDIAVPKNWLLCTPPTSPAADFQYYLGELS